MQADIDYLEDNELVTFFEECEQLHQTGILPKDAKLRAFVKRHGLEDTVLSMSVACMLIYRAIAVKHIEFLDRPWIC